MGVTGSGAGLELRRKRLRALAVATSLTAALFLTLAVGAVAAVARSDPPAPAGVLQQLLNGRVACVSPDAMCTVNLFGPDGDPSPPPVAPGSQNLTTVQLRNAGTVPAASLTLSPSACTHEDLSPGTIAHDICPVLTVAIACTTGSHTFSFGPMTLANFGTAGVLTINSGQAVGEAATCRFTTTYPSTAPHLPEVERVVQPVTWTMTQAQAPPPPPPPTTAPPTTAPPSTAPPTTTPPTTAAPSVVPPVTSPPSVPPSVVSPSVPPSQVAPAPGAPSRLAFTGGDALPLALTGLALLLLGALLFWLSRRRGRDTADVSPPAT